MQQLHVRKATLLLKTLSTPLAQVCALKIDCVPIKKKKKKIVITKTSFFEQMCPKHCRSSKLKTRWQWQGKKKKVAFLTWFFSPQLKTATTLLLTERLQSIVKAKTNV